MKGNNGKAARRNTLRRTAMAVVGCASFLLVLVALNSSSSSQQDGRAVSGPQAAAVQRLRKKAVNWMADKNQQLKRRYHKFHPPEPDEATVLEMILSAQIHLVDIRVQDEEKLQNAPSDGYAGIVGSFCKLNFQIHKDNPSGVPMFRDLVNGSPECNEKKWQFDLAEVVSLVRTRDHGVSLHPDVLQVPKPLPIAGVVFHESRCGSTLVANMLIGMEPKHHRVYSESSPPATAIHSICGDDFKRCSHKQAATLLRDVMYLMSRTDDPIEERVFFKMQSITTRHMSVFLEAYPQVPWMFVYRDAVQVMMSHMRNGKEHANCVRSKRFPPKFIKDMLSDRTGHPDRYAPEQLPADDAIHLPAEYYCAAHLAGITETAAKHIMADGSLGIPVDYSSLPDRMWEDIVPNRLGIPVSDVQRENMSRTATQYSKGRGGNRSGEWKDDSQAKQEEASHAVKAAAKIFLQPSLDTLLARTAAHVEEFKK